MITITNKSGDLLGECEYELEINGEVLATFTHYRPAGLAVCLQKAAEAYEKAQWGKAGEMLRKMKEEGGCTT